MGAETHVSAGDVRWLTPLPLWTGILAGPIAWAVDLTASSAVTKWTCPSGVDWPFQAITVAALAITAGGGALSWAALQQTRGDTPQDGGSPRQRAHFMAVLGLAISAFFALAIVAMAIPWWVFDACH